MRLSQFPPMVLLLALLSILLGMLTTLAECACANCREEINAFCCKTDWQGVCCEYPLSYFQRMRGSSSRYSDNGDQGDSFGLNRHQIRRFRRPRKHHNKSKTLLESKLLAALEQLLQKEDENDS